MGIGPMQIEIRLIMGVGSAFVHKDEKSGCLFIAKGRVQLAHLGSADEPRAPLLRPAVGSSQCAGLSRQPKYKRWATPVVEAASSNRSSGVWHIKDRRSSTTVERTNGRKIPLSSANRQICVPRSNQIRPSMPRAGREAISSMVDQRRNQSVNIHGTIGTSVRPFSAASLSLSAWRSCGSPASGPYCDSAGSAVATATASSAAGGGAQCTIPAAIIQPRISNSRPSYHFWTLSVSRSSCLRPHVSYLNPGMVSKQHLARRRGLRSRSARMQVLATGTKGGKGGAPWARDWTP